MNYVFNPYPERSFLSGYFDYLQDVELVGGITTAITEQTNDISKVLDYQRRDLEKTFQTASKEQIQSMKESTTSVCGTLDDGFELLSNHLEEINYGLCDVQSELNQMASILDEKLSILITHQRVTNLLLGNIAVLLRIPDIQKERQHYIEQGLKFFENSLYDKDLFSDALRNFLKAEEIEPTDYFTLHHIGLIYTYSKEKDIPKAEEYFRRAAKYSIVESNPRAIITQNYLAGDLSKNLRGQITSSQSIRLQAAESYMCAGRICYAQGKFKDAAELAGKGFSAVPELAVAGFIQAKALAASGNETEAATVVEKVVAVDRFFSLQIANDKDLGTKEKVKAKLEELRNAEYIKANGKILKYKSIILPNSQAKNLLKTAENIVNRKSFLHCKLAIDLMSKKNNYEFERAIIKR